MLCLKSCFLPVTIQINLLYTIDTINYTIESIKKLFRNYTIDTKNYTIESIEKLFRNYCIHCTIIHYDNTMNTVVTY